MTSFQENTFAVRFDRRDPVYAVHFPGCAVVPGSLIVAFFCRAVSRNENHGRLWRIENVRFRHFVTPGVLYKCRIEKRATDANGGCCFQCALLKNGAVMAKGKILWR